MKLPIKEIKPNPNNPRVIKDDKFKKLVQSLKDFPEMTEVREIVVNKDHMILGGNMRLKAMIEAGWTEAPVRVVDWSEEKQKEFIIKDNVSYGEWDWDTLANQFEIVELEMWGLDTNNLNTTKIIDEISLPDGEKNGFEQITFTLTTSQAELVKAALLKAKEHDLTEVSDGNDNINANSIAFVCKFFNGNKG